MAIWVLKDGQREGPYAEQDVRELVYEGTYTDSDLAIRDGQSDWSPLGQVLGRQPPAPEATPHTAPPPPPPPPPALPPELPAAVPPPDRIGSPARQPPLFPSAISAECGLQIAESESTTARPIQVTVVDFNMPFGSMVMLMVKWALASIPALLILGALGALFWVAFLTLISVALRH